MLDLRIACDVAGIESTARQLARLGSGDLTEAIADAVERAAAPLPDRARLNARETLPSRGGLADIVSRTNIPVVTRLRGRRAGVLIVARAGAVKDPAAINRGRVRKAVFGRWPARPVIQIVKPGWFTDPMVASRDEVREEIRVAVRAILMRAMSGGSARRAN